MNRTVCLGLLLLALFSATTVHAQGTVGALRRLLESGRVPAERQGTILEMICTRGEPDDLAVAFQMLSKPGALSFDLQRKVMELLTDAAITRKVKPSGDLSAIAKFIAGDEAATDRRRQAAAIRLAATWKLKEVASTLSDLAKDPKAAPALQQAALDGLVSIGGAESKKTLEQVIASAPSNTVKIAAAAALAKSDSTAGADAIANLLAKVQSQDDVGPMLDAELSRKDGADKLAAALKAKAPPADAAKMALRYIYSIGRSDAELSDVLSKASTLR